MNSAIWNVFLNGIDDLLVAKQRDVVWDHQGEVSRLNTKIEELETELDTAKRAMDDLQLSSSTELAASALLLENLQAEKDAAASKPQEQSTETTDLIKTLKHDRDRYKRQRDSADAELKKLKSTATSLNERIIAKDNFIKKLKEEKMELKRKGQQFLTESSPTAGPSNRDPDKGPTSSKKSRRDNLPAPTPPTAEIVSQEVAIQLRLQDLERRERAVTERETVSNLQEPKTNLYSRRGPFI